MKLLDILLAATFSTVVALFLYSQFYASLYIKYRYETVSGKIISSEVEQIRQEENDGEFSKIVTAYRPKLLYEYQISRVKYFGTRFRAFPRGEDKLWAEQIVKDLPAGKEITVFYNPQTPEKSVLSREFPEKYGEKLLAVVLAILLFSAFGFYRHFYPAEKEPAVLNSGF